MKKILLFASLLIASFEINAQNVGINTTGTTPSANAILDLNSGNNYNLGLIMPHVTLGASLATFSPPIANAATIKDTGMIVYNIGGSQAVGYYYWNGTIWVSVTGLSASSVAWLLVGNSGTTPATNWLGTNDAEALQFKVDGSKSGWIDYTSPYNTTFGYQAGNGITTGNDNTVLGYQALKTSSVGSSNVAIGKQALTASTASQNVAVGDSALASNITGVGVVAVGYQALTSSTGASNTALGFKALYSNTNGRFSTAIGYEALYNNTTGVSSNTAIGYEAMYGNTNTWYNVAVGSQALYTQSFNGGITFGTYNVAIGYEALFANNPIGIGPGSNTGQKNTAVGDFAMTSNTTGYFNTAVGMDAMTLNNTGQLNTSIGMSAMLSNTSGSSNTSFGYQALQTNSTGNNLTAVGYNADVSVDGLTNATAIGNSAIVSTSNTMVMGNNSVTQFEFNGALMPYYSAAYQPGTLGQVLTSQGAGVAPQWTAASSLIKSYVKDSAWLLTGNSGTTPGTNFLGTIDDKALEFKTNSILSGVINPDVADGSVFFGSGAGNYGGGGTQSVSIGYQAGKFNTSSQNIFVGYQSGYSNTNGGGNTSIGAQALYTNTGGSDNTALGINTLYSNTSGYENAGAGDYALYSVTTGYNNTAIGGEFVASSISSGHDNTALGAGALGDDDVGNFNTAVGSYAGQNVNSATAVGDVSLGAYAQSNASQTGSSNIGIGYFAQYGRSSVNGFGNIGIGSLAQYYLSTGTGNVSTGYAALEGNGATVTGITGSYNTATGFESNFFNGTGVFNTSEGAYSYAGSSTTTGSSNTAIGTRTLFNATTTSRGTAIGDSALANTTTGANNTAVGYQTLSTNTTGANNTAVGYQANVASGALTNATAIGNGATVSASNTMVFGNNSVTQYEFNGALMPFYTAAYQPGTLGQVLSSQGAGVAPQWTAVSSLVKSYVKDSAWLLTGNFGTSTATNWLGTNDAQALQFKVDGQKSGWIDYQNTATTSNAFFGYESGKNNTGGYNTGMGYLALQANTSGSNNTAMGYDALYTNTTGIKNTAIGWQALYNTNAAGVGYNVAVGDEAMIANTTGQWNVAIGTLALNADITGTSNIAIGGGAVSGNTGGSFNIGIGQNAINSGTGSNNTAVGYHAASANSITGSGNDGIGVNILNNLTGGSNNDAMGYQALYHIVNSSNNVAIGYQSLYNLVSNVGNNVAIGYQSLYTSVGSSGGAENTAIGYQTLYSVNSTSGFGFNNTAVGYQAGYSNSTGIHNTSLGTKALYNDNGGSWNTAVGENALYNQSSGSPSLPGNGTGNTAMGFQALYNNTTSTTGAGQNSAFGVYALQTNVTGSYNTGLGYQADVSTGTLTNATALGAYAQATSSNSLVLGSNGVLGTAITQVDFTGALEPYYGGNYNAGTTGQVLTSQGPGVAPQWTAASGGISYVKDSAWLLTGNSGTTYGTNFIGTIDDKGLMFKINNQTSGRIEDFSGTGEYGNTALGYEALNAVTTGISNTAIGVQALYKNTTGYRNLAMGDSALQNNTAGFGNVAIGEQALVSNTSGKQNVVVGDSAGAANTSSGYSVLVGYGAMRSNLGGLNNGGNTAIGYKTGYYQSSGLLTRATFVGYEAGFSLTSPSTASIISPTYYGNTEIGYQAGFSSSSYANAFLSESAVQSTSGNAGVFNTFVGYQAGYSNAYSGTNTANDNTFLGYGAGWNATATGSGGEYDNTFIGFNPESAAGTFTGVQNVWIGSYTGYLSASGNGNSFLGYDVAANNSGNNNTFIGWASASGNTSGSNNTTLGGNSSVGSSNTGSTAIGYQATANGTSNSTALGISAGASNINATALGANTSASGNNSTAVGNGTTVSVDNNMMFGNSSVIGWGFGAVPVAGSEALIVGNSASNGNGANLTLTGNWTSTSDSTKKHNIQNISYGLPEVMKLRPVSYKWKGTDINDIGFLAQEVKHILPEVVYGEEGHMTLSYGQITPVLTKAIQQQQQMIDSLKAENAILQNQTKTQAAKLDNLQNAQTQDEQQIAELKRMINSMMQVQASAKQ